MLKSHSKILITDNESEVNSLLDKGWKIKQMISVNLKDTPKICFKLKISAKKRIDSRRVAIEKFLIDYLKTEANVVFEKIPHSRFVIDIPFAKASPPVYDPYTFDLINKFNVNDESFVKNELEEKICDLFGMNKNQINILGPITPYPFSSNNNEVYYHQPPLWATCGGNLMR
jgi:hypothetical protein